MKRILFYLFFFIYIYYCSSQSLKEFSLNIQRVCHNKTLPPEPYNILWDQILRLTYNTLLDGYFFIQSNFSHALSLDKVGMFFFYFILFYFFFEFCFIRFSAARKCTNEGRALMQLDLRQLQLKMDSLTRLRPLPDASLVETYIKAYYLPESSLDEWVRQHTVRSLFKIQILDSNFTHFILKNANLIVNSII